MKLKNLQKEKAAEIERMKQEIEAKYADTISLINKKKEELESKKAELEGQLFIYDTEFICHSLLLGRNCNFCSAKKKENMQILKIQLSYIQKIRFFKMKNWEDMQQFYDFDGSRYSKHTFEELLKNSR